jgi:multiple sugar transport system substrate-binding protein
VVANNSIVPLLNDDLIRPLDDLVAKYGQAATEPADQDRRQGHGHRLHGQRPAPVLPQGHPGKGRRRRSESYEDVLAAAKAIKDAGLMEYPLAAATSRAGISPPNSSTCTSAPAANSSPPAGRTGHRQ